ncbi:MAG: glycosyltransferase family 2 protein [Candidatus Levybacteria bacterium]|nr:glycosyltransferase family 2 protein [Candidatus Levybacteria bacterium]
MQKVSFIILNYNGKDNTIKCLKSIENTSLPKDTKMEIIVVDNASIDDSLSNIKRQFPNVYIIANKENLGYSKGNNMGIKYALENGTDFIIVMNNDTIVDKNLITEFLKSAEKDENIGIVVPKIYFAKGYEFHKDRYQEKDKGKIFWYAGGTMDWANVIGHHKGVDEVDRGQYDKEEGTEFATGCCMLVRKDVFGKIGLFNEKYFLYYEDNDFSQKAKKAGYKIIYSPKAIIWHKNAASAGGSGSSLQDYYITRNRILFGIKYAPFKSKLALIRESISFLLKGRYWQKRGIWDFYTARFDKGSFNV